MKSPFIWLVAFVLFCGGSWFAVENSMNTEFRTTMADQAKQIETLKLQEADTVAKAYAFRNNLDTLLPDKVEVIKAAFVAQFGDQPAPVEPTKNVK